MHSLAGMDGRWWGWASAVVALGVMAACGPSQHDPDGGSGAPQTQGAGPSAAVPTTPTPPPPEPVSSNPSSAADAGATPSTDGGTSNASDPQPDPGATLRVTPSGAPGCDGLLPSSIPLPTTIRVGVSASFSCSDAWTSDGQGDVAVPCDSGSGGQGFAILYSRDGATKGQLFTRTTPQSTTDGFASAYSPSGSGGTLITFAFTSDGAWQSTQFSEDLRAMSQLIASPQGGALLLSGTGGGATSQWFDAHGTPVRPARSWPQVASFEYAALDSAGNALVAYRDGHGALRGQWISSADADLGAPFDAPALDPESEPITALAGSGVILGRRAIALPGQPLAPVPAWLSTRPEPFQTVRGSRAYAFLPHFAPGAPACAPSVELVLPDGTSCGTIDVLEPGSMCPSWARVGPDGTLMHGMADTGSPQGQQWRWWPGLLK